MSFAAAVVFWGKPVVTVEPKKPANNTVKAYFHRWFETFFFYVSMSLIEILRFVLHFDYSLRFLFGSRPLLELGSSEELAPEAVPAELVLAVRGVWAPERGVGLTAALVEEEEEPGFFTEGVPRNPVSRRPSTTPSRTSSLVRCGDPSGCSPIVWTHSEHTQLPSSSSCTM